MQLAKTLNLCFAVIFLCFVQSVQGASFIFMPLDKQLRDSDAVVEGIIRDSTTKKDPRGQVITRYSLSLSWAAGLDRNQDVHPDSFHINVPGGPWQGINYQVSGAPSFKEGEKVFLLLKESKFGHVVLNLSLGKYNVYQKGQETLLKSNVFPDHPAFHQIKLDEVKKMAKQQLKTFTSYKVNGRSVRTKQKQLNTGLTKQGARRKIASVSNQKGESQQRSSLFWPFLVLVFIATIKKLFRVRSK